jgi:hypothetical protein
MLFRYSNVIKHQWGGSAGKLAVQMWEHPFCHWSQLKDQEMTLGNKVRKTIGWCANRCQNISGFWLLLISHCNSVGIEFLEVTYLEISLLKH